MICPNCSVCSEPEAIFCKQCGVTLLPNAVLTDNRESPDSSVLQVRPWVRCWARMFDITLITVIVGVVLGLFFPAELKKSDFELQFATFGIWVFIESLLLWKFGTTPGKAFFRTQLRLPQSGSMPLMVAFHRSLKVWWRGLGAGVGIIMLVALVYAHIRLSRDGMTSWDKEGGFAVVHGKISPIRVVVAVVWFGLFFAAAVAGTFEQIK